MTSTINKNNLLSSNTDNNDLIYHLPKWSNVYIISIATFSIYNLEEKINFIDSVITTDLINHKLVMCHIPEQGDT